MLRANKVRSFLTMLGIIIGVMGVSVTVELVEGFRTYMSAQFASIGANTLFVVYDPGMRIRGETLGGVDSLKSDDIKAIEAECPAVNEVSGQVICGSYESAVGDLSLKNCEVDGVEPGYFRMRGLEPVLGRILDDDDIREWTSNTVIGSEVALKLFPGGDPIGKRITVKGKELTVVGTLKAKGSSMGQTEDTRIYIPITAAQKRWTGNERIHVIVAQPVSEAETEHAMDQMWKSLMRHHNNKPVYRIGSQEALASAFGAIITGLGVVFAGVAALALLVGGIGIMNIMLVSVTERTREIGLRMAVGAKRWEVLLQFLVESATLSLIGGLIGMLLGYGMGQLVDWFTHSEFAQGMPGITMTFPVWAGVGAALFSASVGVVFGIYPAWRAASMDPIEALRHE